MRVTPPLPVSPNLNLSDCTQVNPSPLDSLTEIENTSEHAFGKEMEYVPANMVVHDYQCYDTLEEFINFSPGSPL